MDAMPDGQEGGMQWWECAAIETAERPARSLMSMHPLQRAPGPPPYAQSPCVIHHALRLPISPLCHTT
jgi:hypothetical protein